jgi:hypothetical protein
MDMGDTTTLRAVASGPDYLAGMPPEMHGHVRDRLIESDPEAKAAQTAAKEFDEQEHAAQRLEHEALQSVADMVDFKAADSYAAAAKDALGNAAD